MVRVARTAVPTPADGRDAPLAIFRRFLRFGLLAWGGPAPRIAAIKRECVDERGWVSQETFRRTLVYQVLPGPEASERWVVLGAGAIGAALQLTVP